MESSLIFWKLFEEISVLLSFVALFMFTLLSIPLTVNSRPQRPCSFWSLPRIAICGPVQQRNCPRFTETDLVEIRNEYSAHVHKIRSGKRSRFLPSRSHSNVSFGQRQDTPALTKRHVGSGNEIAIPGADQKERGLWGRMLTVPVVFGHRAGTDYSASSCSSV